LEGPLHTFPISIGLVLLAIGKGNPMSSIDCHHKGPLGADHRPVMGEYLHSDVNISTSLVSPSVSTLSHGTGALTSVPIGSTTARLKSCGWFTMIPRTFPSATTFKTQRPPELCAFATEGTPNVHSVLRLTAVNTRIHLRHIVPIFFSMILFLQYIMVACTIELLKSSWVSLFWRPLPTVLASINLYLLAISKGSSICSMGWHCERPLGAE
jgi:hypothetical protein